MQGSFAFVWENSNAKAQRSPTETVQSDGCFLWFHRDGVHLGFHKTDGDFQNIHSHSTISCTPPLTKKWSAMNTDRAAELDHTLCSRPL